jgi:hypothetical protein
MSVGADSPAAATLAPEEMERRIDKHGSHVPRPAYFGNHETAQYRRNGLCTRKSSQLHHELLREVSATTTARRDGKGVGVGGGCVLGKAKQNKAKQNKT